MKICHQLLLQYECEGNKLSYNTFIGDKSLVHHIEPENKILSQRFASTKELKNHTSGRQSDDH
jgi:hypothetical protein